MAPDSESIPPERAVSARKRPHLGPLWLFFGLVFAAWVFPYTPASNHILCPFRWLTGIICPGCGMTRSVMAFVRGDFLSSLHFHPFGPLLVTGLGFLGSLRLADRLRDQEHFPALRAWYARYTLRLSLILLAAVLLFWAIRLVTGAP